jgi:hypothetical protein
MRPHLRSWLVETSADEESWREAARDQDKRRLNGRLFAGIFAVAGRGECRFTRLVNIGRNHLRSDCLSIFGWEIFGSLIVQMTDSSDVIFAFTFGPYAVQKGRPPGGHPGHT